jgi:tRNA nucleotidyltransferase (CCA-adding enzyme)
MAAQEPDQVTAAATAVPFDPIALLRSEAPWLLAPALGACLVGSQALAHVCRAAGVDGPHPVDIDLAWGLDLAAGQALLQQHGVFVPTTTGNQERGTLAMKVGGRRLEVTTFRSGAATAPLHERILADLGERDMTIGAVAVELATGRAHDPAQGLQHWQQRRIVPVGDAAQRVREHPIRWLRYYRKAHELGFQLDRQVRSLELDPALLHTLPREAIALELRAVLGKCRSPGRCFLELHEDGLLATLTPELARQFDGRPAGPQRWHPEVSQSLHLILALEWANANTGHLDERDRLAVAIAVLCHDLGKGWTPADDLPQHIGHERDGLPHVDSLLARWPGFADQRTTTLARHVCALHVEVRNFAELRPGTLAELYDTWFRGKDYPVELFALAVAADSAGRLGHTDDGPRVAAQVRGDLDWLRAVCGDVDATSLRERFPDLAEFRRALHEARAQAIARARSRR